MTNKPQPGPKQAPGMAAASQGLTALGMLGCSRWEARVAVHGRLQGCNSGAGLSGCVCRSMQRCMPMTLSQIQMITWNGSRLAGPGCAGHAGPHEVARRVALHGRLQGCPLGGEHVGQPRVGQDQVDAALHQRHAVIVLDPAVPLHWQGRSSG